MECILESGIMTDETKPIDVQLATLDDLSPTLLNVIIELEDGREALMRLKTLSSFRIAAIQATIALPAPPQSGFDKVAQPVYNYHDASYQNAYVEVQIKRNLLVLAHMIQEPAIPGETEAEKLAWMEEHISPAIQDQLLRLIKVINSKGEARIYHRASTFHPNGTANAEDMPADGLDTSGLEQVA